MQAHKQPQRQLNRSGAGWRRAWPARRKEVAAWSCYWHCVPFWKQGVGQGVRDHSFGHVHFNFTTPVAHAGKRWVLWVRRMQRC